MEVVEHRHDDDHQRGNDQHRGGPGHRVGRGRTGGTVDGTAVTSDHRQCTGHDGGGCARCRRRAAAARALVADRARAVRVVAALEPTVPARAIAEAVSKAARSPSTAYRLAVHLRNDPNVLTRGTSAMPPVVRRLVVLLLQAGATRVVLPGCARCGRAVALTHRPGSGRICDPCYQQARTVACAACGRHRPIRTRTPDGAPLCSGCRRHNPALLQACSRCGRDRLVNARTADGAPLCSGCYQPPTMVCDGCQATAPVAGRRDGRALCRRCHRRPRRPCGWCGRVRLVAKRATADQPDLCGACHQGPVAVCATCGQQGPCKLSDPTGPTCLRCQLARRLDALLAGPDGTIAAPLAKLRAAILAADNPRTALGWLGRSPAVGVLARLAAGAVPATHDTLDAADPSPAVEHLRALLVAAGLLPERDHHLARLEQAIATLATTLEDPDDRRLLRAFGTWRVLARLRRRTAHGKGGVLAARNARARLAEAARFLAWLRAQGRSLATCRQADLDQWLASGPTTRRLVRDLLAWAATRGMLDDLDLPTQQRGSLPRPVDDDARWQLVRRLLHDPALDPADRVAGALVTLYAQPVSRISQLTRGDVSEREGAVLLHVGRDQLLLPKPLASLLRTLPADQPAGTAGRLPTPTAWLFPGRQPGRPIHPEQLRRRLGALGIACRANRTSALLHLAAEVPAVVLADLLGLHPTTAERWAKLAAGNWARYAADAAKQPAHP